MNIIPAKSESKVKRLKDIRHGTTFYKKGDYSRLLMKVKPVNYLLNSTLITDKIVYGDCMVVALASGTVYFTDGTCEVDIRETTLIVAEPEKKEESKRPKKKEKVVKEEKIEEKYEERQLSMYE